jgi:hypothetical protein
MINSPRGFSTVWAVIKRFLDPVTVEKISILGKDYQSTLLSQIPKENLPKRFGGECQCPGGCELSDAGPWQEDLWTRVGTSLTEQSGSTRAESEVSLQRTGTGIGAGGRGERMVDGSGVERLDVPKVAA